MAKVIENLVINKGFVMKNQRDQVLTLENPLEPETIYWILTDTLVWYYKENKETSWNVGSLIILSYFF